MAGNENGIGSGGDIEAAQNGLPTRPQRATIRGVLLWYVEGLSEARTKVEAVFSDLILQTYPLADTD